MNINHITQDIRVLLAQYIVNTEYFIIIQLTNCFIMLYNAHTNTDVLQTILMSFNHSLLFLLWKKSICWLDIWCSSLPFLSGVWYAQALEVNTGKIHFVEVMNGSSVLLPCTYASCIGIKNLYFNWQFKDNGTLVKVIHSTVSQAHLFSCSSFKKECGLIVQIHSSDTIFSLSSVRPSSQQKE